MKDRARTNSLHRKLTPELRRMVEEDLVQQPAGRSSMREVHEFYELDKLGVSFFSLKRYARYLRYMYRTRQVRKLADRITAIDGLGKKNVALVREKLCEELLDGDASAGDLMKLSIVEKNLAAVALAEEQWAAKRDAAKREIQKAVQRSAGQTLDADQVADLIDRVMRGEGL